MFDIQTFSEALKHHRILRGLTQAELAERLLVTPQSVSRWECGEVVPDIRHLAEISELLGVSLDTLVMNRQPESKGIIGIDAGGTKTEFVLIDEEGNRKGRIVLEGSNPNVCGIEQTVRIATQGISLLRPQEMQVLGIFFGGAGMRTGNHAEVLRKELRKAFPGIRIFCDSDAMNVIACASEPECCIAAISGTGSVVYVNDHGSVARVGGTGYLFEKFGSGYDVGRDAITAAFRDRDGLGEHTLLTELVEKKLGGTPWEHIQQLYSGDISFIASFSRLVSEAADKGDRVALEIFRQNSAHVAKLICAASKRLPEAKSVIVSGSMLVACERFRRMTIEQLPDTLNVEILDYPIVFGACLQCARLLGLKKLPKLQNFLKNTDERTGK